MAKEKTEVPSFDKYSIFETGGKQYHAIEGKTIAIEKLDINEGDSVDFENVLLRKVSNDDVQIGQPYLKDPVKAVVVKHMRGPKLIVFKFKRRKKYRTKQGHRQSMTVVRIKSI